MADNQTVYNGPLTQYDVAADSVAVAGTQPIGLVQYVKLVDGTPDGTDPVAATAAYGLRVDVSRVTGTVAVSAASLPLPTGAATEATLSTLNGKITACNTGAVVISSGSVTVSATNLDVRDLTSASDSVTAHQGGAWSVGVTGTVAVSAASLPLPTGAATEATLSALNGKVTACNTGAVVVASGNLTVSATSLDVRDLAYATDSVTAVQGGVWSVAAVQSGGWTVGVAGTVAVSAASLPLPTGAATEATLATLNGKITACNTGAVVISSGSVTVNAADLDIRDLTSVSDSVTAHQGGAWSVGVTGTVAVSAVALPLPAGAATEATLSALNGKITACNTGAVVIASGSVTVSATSLDIRDLTSASDSVTAQQGGNWSVRAQDGGGNALTSAARGSERALSVQLVDAAGNQITSFGGGSGGTSHADDAAFAVGSAGSVTPVAGVATSDTVDAGDAGAVAMTVYRGLHVNLRDSSGNEVAVGGGTQYAENAASAGGEQLTLAGAVRQDAPAGGATADGDYTTLKTDAVGRLWVRVGDTAAVTQSGTWNIGTVTNVVHVDDNGGALTVDGTVSVGNTVAVSAAALPLPTGAATESTLSTLNGKVTACNTGAVVIASGAVTVSATDLDVRDLSYAADSVTAHQGGSWTVAAAQSGAWSVGVTGTVAVSAVSLPLPTGAATEATLSALNGKVTACDTGAVVIASGAVTVSATNLDVRDLAYASDSVTAHQGGSWTVAVSGTVPVSAVALPLPAGAATEATLSSLNGKVTACNTGAVVIASGSVTVSATDLDIRNLTSAADSVAAAQSGNWAVRAQDGSGNALTSAARGSERALSVQLVDAAGGQITSFAGTEYAEDAASAANPVGPLLLGRRRDTPAAETTTDGDNVALNATNKGELYVKHLDAIPVTDNGGALTVDGTVSVGNTVAVSAVSLPLPTGAATEATLSTLNGKVTACNTGAVVISSGSVTVSATNLDVRDLDYTADSVTAHQGGSWTVAVSGTVAVSAVALPLPTGAATEATLSTLNGKVTACDTGAVVIASGAVTVSATNLDVRDLAYASDSVTAHQGGTWTVGVSGTVPISAAALPLPTGAATEATLSTLNGKVTACNTGAVVVASGSVTVSATDLDVRDLAYTADSVTAHQGGTWTVGISGTVPVSAAALPLPTGAATEATLSSLNGKVTACNTGAVVIASGSVTVSATNLDVRDLTSASDSVAAVQSGTWTVGLTADAVSQAVYDETADGYLPVGGQVLASPPAPVGDTRGAPFRMTPYRALHVNLRAADGSEIATVPVSAASLPLPAGAATEATLSTLNGKVTACNTGAVVVASGSVTVSATDLDIRPLTSAVDQVTVYPGSVFLVGQAGDWTVAVSGTVAVSASSLPLPTGAATEATLSTLNGKVTACNTGAVVVASGAVAATQSGAWSTRTQDGAGNAVTSHTAGASRGLDVCLLDASGGHLTTVPTAEARGSTASLSNVSGSASSVTLLAANTARKQVVIYNDSAAALYVKYGTTASATSFTYLVPAYSTLESDVYAGRIDGIWASATGSARVTEVT